MEENKININENQEEITPEEKIELLRAQFLNGHKKDRIVSYVVLFVFLILMIGAFYLLLNRPEKILIIFLCIIVLFLGTFIITRKLKSTRENELKAYITNYREVMNNEIYKDIELKDVETNPFGEFNHQEIIDLNLFADLKNIKSNDLVTAKYNEKAFSSSSVACFNNDNNIVFYGKVYSLEVEKTQDSKIVVYYKTKDGVGPLKEEKVNLIQNFINDKYACLSIHEFDYLNETINKDMKNVLKTFNENEYLKDITLVLKDNKMYLLVSCKNDVIDVALNESLDKNVIDNLKQTSKIFFDLVKGI